MGITGNLMPVKLMNDKNNTYVHIVMPLKG